MFTLERAIWTMESERIILPFRFSLKRHDIRERMDREVNIWFVGRKSWLQDYIFQFDENLSQMTKSWIFQKLKADRKIKKNKKRRKEIDVEMHATYCYELLSIFVRKFYVWSFAFAIKIRVSPLFFFEQQTFTMCVKQLLKASDLLVFRNYNAGTELYAKVTLLWILEIFTRDKFERAIFKIYVRHKSSKSAELRIIIEKRTWFFWNHTCKETIVQIVLLAVNTINTKLNFYRRNCIELSYEIE